MNSKGTSTNIDDVTVQWQTKSLSKTVAEHKDVVKLSMQLNTTVTTLKTEVADMLAKFNIYDALWKQVSAIERGSGQGGYGERGVGNMNLNKPFRTM